MFDIVEIAMGSEQLLCAFDGNRLHDLLLLGDGKGDVGAIYLAKIERPIKGIGGVFVSLGGKEKGFWRVKKPPREGALVPLQLVQTAMRGKPARFSERIDFRGVYFVLTPGREGVNVSRSWKSKASDALRADIEKILPENCGVILRSEAEGVDADVLLGELQALIGEFEKVQAASEIGLIAAAPIGQARAELEWGVKSLSGKFAPYQKDAIAEALSMPLKAAGGEIRVENTHALIAVDIDTGANTAPSAGRDVNTRAAAKLMRWLGLMGWAGQIVIDPAPMPMQARKGFEGMLQKAAKACGVDFVTRGFGPLGLCEGQIRYARRPLPGDFLERIERDEA